MLKWFANPIKTATYAAWALSIFLWIPVQSFSAQTTLAWDPNDPAPEGYRIFQRLEGQAYDYSQPVWSGPDTTGTVDGLVDGDRYYFVVRAYAGTEESADSNEVSFQSTLPATTTYTVSANAGPHGSISPNTAVTVADGEDQSFTITPDTGYHIADVVVDGVSQGAVTAYTFHQVSRNHSINASFVANTYTITASAGPNGSISPQGVVSIDYGGSLTFTIVPEAGYHVADVKVDGLSKGSLTSYTFNQVAANRSIEASFSTDSYTVPQTTQATLAWDPNDPTPDGYRIYQRTEGQAYDYTAPVWTGSGTTGTVYNLEYDTTYYFVVRAYVGELESDDSNEVVFSGQSPLPVTYTIAVTSGSNGSVSPGSSVTVTSGADQMFMIAPATGYHVSDVRVDGVSVGSVSSYTFSQVAANHSLTAFFDIDTHLIAISAGANGSIAPSGTLSVENGASETVTITADTGYRVSDVTVDGVSVGAVSTYTFSDVETDHIIAASFVIDTYTISASSGANGSITPSGSASVACGADVTYTIMPDAGCSVSDVAVDGISIGAVSSYTFSQVDANHTIHAAFATATYAITASAGEHGSVTPAGTVSIPMGASQTYTFTPDSGFHIEDVRVDGQSVGSMAAYTFNDIDGDHTIDITFAENTVVKVWIEAEDGDLKWPMEIGDDEGADAGGFVWVAEGTGIAGSPSEDSGYAEYHFEVPESGNYVIWGRQVSNDTASDSFFVSIDDQDEMVWHTKHGGQDVWTWDVVATRDASDPDYMVNPEIFWLTDGPHTLKVTQREDGTKLDRLLITNQTDLTDPESDSVVDAMEYGEVEIDHRWQRIVFKKPFVNPVVVPGPIGLNGGDPAVVRIQKVDAYGFEMRIQEWDYLDGYHAVERVSYLVMEQGNYTLEDGTKIEAGVMETGTSDAFKSIVFNKSFNVVPVVITAITSINDAACVTGRMSNIGLDGFKYGMQEQESNANDHTAEALAYIAWEPSAGAMGDVTYVVARTGDAVKTKLFKIGFERTYATSPAFMADMQTADGRDVANLRYDNKGEASVDVKIYEEQSKDTEMGHTSEVVGYMLLGR